MTPCSVRVQPNNTPSCGVKSSGSCSSGANIERRGYGAGEGCWCSRGGRGRRIRRFVVGTVMLLKKDEAGVCGDIVDATDMMEAPLDAVFPIFLYTCTRYFSALSRSIL